MRADTVGRGWATDAKFLNGVGFANMLPAPLVMFATFTGSLSAGLPGALAVRSPDLAVSAILFAAAIAVVYAWWSAFTAPVVLAAGALAGAILLR